MKNITIYLNNGMIFDAAVEDYNAEKFSSKMNDPQVATVSIGDIVVSKLAIFLILPSEVVPTV